MTYYIRHHSKAWFLIRSTDDRAVGMYDTRDECVDAWARAAKLPVCSICRCVHGSEIQHECE